MNEEQNNNNDLYLDFLKEEQKYEDRKAFIDSQTNEYIAHLGFNKTSDFDIAIKETKSNIKSSEELLSSYQNEINEISSKLSYLKPEDDFTNQIPKMEEQKEELRKLSNKLVDKIKKEKKNLKELEDAKKAYLQNKRATYKDEAKDRASTLEQIANAERELKNLEGKIYMGTATKLEEARRDALKYKILPELQEELNKHKIETPQEEPETEENKQDQNKEQEDEEQKDEQEQTNENEEETLEEKIEKNLNVEGPKKVKFMGKAADKLRGILEANAAKAVMALAGITALVVLILSNPALAFAAPTLWAVNEFDKARRGK